ncbi:DNA-binding protein [Facilibium subflavum]|uniref:DNA-binding protein n=1 Tax=Facilibium subflavum TaxID=2219058 RepID=UPI000E659256|nr:DNA-binding protein [Facilibium subflavum]
MSDENQLTYEEVAQIADSLLAEGKRVTLEYLRRQLGKGTHAQIAVLLGKWQRQQKGKKMPKTSAYADDSGFKEQKRISGAGSSRALKRPEMNFRTKQSESGRIDKSTKASVDCFDDGKESAGGFNVTTPFSLERLEVEPDVVKRLFMALCVVKYYRARALERQQTAQNESLNLRMASESKIRQIKKEYHEKIVALMSELSRIKAITDREIDQLRHQLEVI